VNRIVYQRADLLYRESSRIVNRTIRKHFESYLFLSFWM